MTIKKACYYLVDFVGLLVLVLAVGSFLCPDVPNAKNLNKYLDISSVIYVFLIYMNLFLSKRKFK